MVDLASIALSSRDAREHQDPEVTNRPEFSRYLASRLLQHYSIAAQLSYHCNRTHSLGAYALRCRVCADRIRGDSYASASHRFYRRNEYVADAALGLDQTRRARIGLQLASQP
jgi:hypothetical protein